MDKKHWGEIARAQRQATPKLSRSQCRRLTAIERRQYEALEANVRNCKGYSGFSALANMVLSKISIAHKLKTTEAGGTRHASWQERTCNNPYLESAEYFARQDEFDTGSDGDMAPFKTAKQRGAFLAGQAAVQRMVTGLMLGVGSQVIPTDVFVEKSIGGGMLGGGLYLLATGAWQSMATLRTEVREHREN